jgi:hypothetical protein
MSSRSSPPARTQPCTAATTVSGNGSAKGLEAWDGWGTMEPQEFSEHGDRVLVALRWRVRGQESGVEVEANQWHLITLRDGHVTRMEFYGSRDEAVAALRGSAPRPGP